jgi:hypothetical protein
MSDVGTWQPDKGDVAPNATVIARLSSAASQLEAPTLGLTPDEVVRYSALMRRPAEEWRGAARTLGDAEIVTLIRFFTVAETRLPNWEAGAQSPVIPLAAELRTRGTYPKELTRWIRSVSRNRFLPWGSLADRL